MRGRSRRPGCGKLVPGGFNRSARLNLFGPYPELFGPFGAAMAGDAKRQLETVHTPSLSTIFANAVFVLGLEHSEQQLFAKASPVNTKGRIPVVAFPAVRRGSTKRLMELTVLQWKLAVSFCPATYAKSRTSNRVRDKVSFTVSGRRTDQTTMRVLIVEDETRLAENVARTLRETAGYAVDLASDGQEGLFLAESNAYDAIVLDLMLPKLDGFEVLKRVRESGQHTPVLVLTARDDKESVVTLLNAGADDYLTKPFDLGELLARTKALIRRGKGQPAPVLNIGDLQLNTVDRTVQRAGRQITLTAMEYRVLEYLAHRPRAVVSKTELLEHLYDYNWEKFSNVIEVYISGLRRKLDVGSQQPLIRTLRGQGYLLQG